MAVDEFLLESAVRDRVCTLRLYEWSEATVSLGYFQDEQFAEQAPEFTQLPKVRRLSGGGAILHHHEFTYSCSVPAAHPLSAEPQSLYARVHECIIDVLARYEIQTSMRGDSFREKDDAFLCFSRGDARDLILNGHKVLGSAQRRRRGAVLQHGSLLLNASPHAPQFPGLADLFPDISFQSDLKQNLAASIGSLFSHESEDFAFSEDQSLAITRWEQLCYSSLLRKKGKRMLDVQ